MAKDAPRSISSCRKFFLAPTHPRHRQYEALRAYFFEGRKSAEAARAFGYTPGTGSNPKKSALMRPRIGARELAGLSVSGA